MSDLFGGDTPVPDKKNESHESKYQKFKKRNHYTESYNSEIRCKTCPNHITIEYHDRYYHKCKLIGNTMCVATDIRINHVCNLHPKMIEAIKNMT